MHIVNAMTLVKQGKTVVIGDKRIYQNGEGKLMQDLSLDYKVQSDKEYIPTLEDMLSNDWRVACKDVQDGTVIELNGESLTVCSDGTGRRFLVDMDKCKVVSEYASTTLLLRDLYRKQAMGVLEYEVSSKEF